MKTQITWFRARLGIFVSAVITAALIGIPIPRTSGGEFVPLKLRGTVTIQSIIPIGIDGDVLTAAVVATDSGWGTHFGAFTSEFHLLVDIDLTTGIPLRGGGVIIQTNADGSTVTWWNQFEGAETGSTITGGSGRFQNAEGWVEGTSVLNADGTFTYDEEGQITSVGSNRRARP